MKQLVIFLFSLSLLFGLSACSNTEGSLGWLNAIANFKLVSKQDPEVNALYKKYSALLNDSERGKALAAYEAIKKAGSKPSIQTPVDYLIAKQLYIDAMPIYQKYKEQIEPLDKVAIAGIHEKLKSISEAVDKAIDSSVKDAQMLEYIKTATLLISAFA